jgi:hypothetical protein
METFNFGIDEYGAELTTQSHQTLYWLNRNGYLSNEVTEDLLSRMIVTPLRNRPSLGKRLLARFFGKGSAENTYVFPITLVDDVVNITDGDGETVDKPTLRVVK